MKPTKIFPALLLSLAVTALAVSPLYSKPTRKNTRNYAHGEVLVKFRERANSWEKDLALSVLHVRRVGILRNVGVQRLQLPRGTSVLDAVDELRRDPAVEFAEPNWKAEWLGRVTPDDPKFADGSQWYLDTATVSGYIGTVGNTFSIDVDIDAPEAWGFMNSLSSIFDVGNVVSVGVLDSGVGESGSFSTTTGFDTGHLDILNSSIFANTAEALPADGFDSAADSNSLVDDRNGWDWIGDDNSPADSDAADNLHGTFITGIIAAEYNNTTDVAGIGKEHLRVLPLRTFILADILQGVDYAIEMVSAGKKVPVLNASWLITENSLLSDAIARAGAAGIVFVAAAGNDGVNNDDSTVYYPAKYSVSLTNVLAVAASDSSGDLATFSSGGSNFGPSSVQMAAPGKNIVSTYKASPAGSRVGTGSGTSFAAPIAASVLGLVMAADSSLSPAQAIDRLINGGYYDARIAGKVSSGKRVNLEGALAPFYPYSGLAPMGTRQSVSMYADSIGALFGTISSAVSSSNTIAVMNTDASGAWAVSPVNPGIASFTVTFLSGPVSSMDTGGWRVTGITPFSSRLQVGQTVDFNVSGSVAGTITWSVDDSSVGTIDANGLFSAVGTGEARVILKINGSPIDNTGPVVVVAAVSSGGGGGCGTVTLPPGSSDWPWLVEFCLLVLLLVLTRRIYGLRAARVSVNHRPTTNVH